MRTKFYLAKAPLLASQLAIDTIFGRRTIDDFEQIVPSLLRFNKETKSLVKIVNDRNWFNRKYSMLKEYNAHLANIKKVYYPKAPLWKKIWHFQKFAKLNRLGHTHMALLERRLLIKYFDMQLCK